MVTTYIFIRFLHVLAAVAGMGPHTAITILVRYMARNPQSVRTLFPVFLKMDALPRYAAFILAGTGALMIAVHPLGWRLLLQPWLAASILLWIFASFLGAARLGPAAGQLAAALARDDATPAGTAALVRRVDGIFGLMTAAMAVTLVLMIYRPSF